MSVSAWSGDWKVQVGPQTKKMYEKFLGDGQGIPLNVPGCNSNLNVLWCRKRLGDVPRDGSLYPPLDGSNCLYHGTDQDSALSILNDGIKFQKGRSCQDFSHKDGFYVNYDYEQAKKWAHEYTRNVPSSKVPGTKVPITKVPVKNVPGTKVPSTNVPSEEAKVRERKYPAVIVFNTENIEDIKCLELIDLNQKLDWQKIVKYNRSGRKSEYCLSGRLINEIKESHFIAGPVCETKIIPRGAFHNWMPSGYESPYRQLCVITPGLAEIFTSEFMESIILFGEMSGEMNKYLVQVMQRKTTDACHSASEGPPVELPSTVGSEGRINSDNNLSALESPAQRISETSSNESVEEPRRRPRIRTQTHKYEEQECH